jgi:hypothetical protein
MLQLYCIKMHSLSSVCRERQPVPLRIYEGVAEKAR